MSHELVRAFEVGGGLLLFVLVLQVVVGGWVRNPYEKRGKGK